MSAGNAAAIDDVYDQINVTPLLDLAYVLLIIFIILTTATVQGIKVNLPKASAQPSLAENKTKAISITADGTIYLDTFPVTLPELENLLRQYKARDAGPAGDHQGGSVDSVSARGRRARPRRPARDHAARPRDRKDRQVAQRPERE